MNIYANLEPRTIVTTLSELGPHVVAEIPAQPSGTFGTTVSISDVNEILNIRLALEAANDSSNV